MTFPRRTDNAGHPPRGAGKHLAMNYKRRNHKRKENVKDMCYNSFEAGSCAFVTLTFAPKRCPDKDLKDLNATHALFKNFIKRVNFLYDDFCYVATFARQSRGNWHYHMICNFGQTTTRKEIAAIWKHGSVDMTHIKDKDHLRNSIFYLLKNMRDAADDLFGRKGYLSSRNAERNIVHKTWTPEGEAALAALQDKIQQSKVKKTYETSEPLGVAKFITDPSTGEDVPVDVLAGEELTDELKAQGYVVLKASFAYYNISLRCPEQFSIPTAAVRKQQPKK
ncbi:MAG: hypothetical protein IJ060_08175 [Oscillospiraceae bacterium]|nr:hypothetical protein [Oscillospiraceae bacterium]